MENKPAKCRVAVKFVILMLTGLVPAHTALGQPPAFDCGRVDAGSIEDLICKDRQLAALDRKLADVYTQALMQAAAPHAPILKAEQVGWIKGRNECCKSDDEKQCVENNYKTRIAELQARYRLIPGTGPMTYTCGGTPADNVVVTFFRTDPPTLIAERGESVALMYLQPSGSGARYQGQNESFWEHHGQAVVTWGDGAPEINCQKRP